MIASQSLLFDDPLEAYLKATEAAMYGDYRKEATVDKISNIACPIQAPHISSTIINTITIVITITNYQLPIAHYQLPISIIITNYQLPINNYPLPITHYLLPITNDNGNDNVRWAIQLIQYEHHNKYWLSCESAFPAYSAHQATFRSNNQQEKSCKKVKKELKKKLRTSWEQVSRVARCMSKVKVLWFLAVIWWFLVFLMEVSRYR